MAARRIHGRATDVTLYLDDVAVPAVAGEPVALSLLCAGKRVLARSVKYHRPRGAACFAGRCDGCLLRVDGVPSLPTCRIPARNGLSLGTQNVVGSAEHDLLAATDFLFPAGMNHHEMFTWSKPVNRTMQLVAREIAGVGTLPDAPKAPLPVRRRDVDVLVVGAGLAGLSFAAKVAGKSVLVVDEEPSAGGSLARWPEPIGALGDRRGGAIAAELAAEATRAGVEILLRTSALGVFAETDGMRRVLCAREGETLVVTPKALVLAPGRAETGWAFAGNDLPGIYGVDAALRALAAGVLVGEKPLLFGEGAALEVTARALRDAGAAPIGPHPLASLQRARGRAGVTSADVGDRKIACDALVVASPEGAVFELAAQAGAETFFDGSTFSIRASETDGATRSPFVRVLGSAAGVRDAAAIVAQAHRAAEVS